MMTEITANIPAGIVEYDFFTSRFGDGLIAATTTGICDLVFTDRAAADPAAALADYHADRSIVRVPGAFANICDALFSARPVAPALDLDGSAFQVDVWTALRQIGRGETVSYRSLARRIGRPKATRAVANAVARNRIAVLVPCHRVIRSDGSLGKYRWGAERKAALLDWECGIAAGAKRLH